MKTNRSARRLVRTRHFVLLFTFIAVVGGAFWLGGSLGMQSRRTTPSQSVSSPPPNASLADCLVAAR